MSRIGLHGRCRCFKLPFSRQPSVLYGCRTESSRQCYQKAIKYSLYCRFTAPEGLRDGADSISQDFATNIYRMKQLGFNAVRLPYRFSDFLYLNPPHCGASVPGCSGGEKPPLLFICRKCACISYLQYFSSVLGPKDEPPWASKYPSMQSFDSLDLIWHIPSRSSLLVTASYCCHLWSLLSQNCMQLLTQASACSSMCSTRWCPTRAATHTCP